MNIQTLPITPYIQTKPLKQNNYNQVNFNGLREDVFEKIKPNSDEELLESLGVDNSIFESETIKQLYSKKFRTPQKRNKDGYYETTIIDKETNEPVKAYLTKFGLKRITDDAIEETWNMYVKNEDEYKLVGSRYFTIDKGKSKITPGYMDSPERNKYKGVGIRLHQLAIERMQQENLADVEITSKPEAFPFHYKCGYRAKGGNEIYPKCIFEQRLNWLNECTKLPKETLVKCMHAKKRLFGGYYVPLKGDENIKRILYSKNKIDFEKTYLSMHLPKDSLKMWENLINSQPILPH